MVHIKKKKNLKKKVHPAKALNIFNPKQNENGIFHKNRTQSPLSCQNGPQIVKAILIQNTAGVNFAP